VLEACRKTLEERTDLLFSYECLKGKAGKVLAIQFRIWEKVKVEPKSEGKTAADSPAPGAVRSILLKGFTEVDAERMAECNRQCLARFGSSPSNERLLGEDALMIANTWFAVRYDFKLEEIVELSNRILTDGCAFRDEIEKIDFLRQVHSDYIIAQQRKANTGGRIGDQFKYFVVMALSEHANPNGYLKKYREERCAGWA
jgi:hypothetical protein